MAQSNASLVDRIIDIARGLAPVGPDVREKREATRVPFNTQIFLVQLTPPGDKTKPLTLQGENISSGGLCVRSAEALDVGSRGAVLLPRSNGELVILGAKVVYSNQQGKTTEYGLEFEPQPESIAIVDFRNPRGNLPEVRPAA